MIELRDKIYKIMYRIFIISIVIACFTTITLGSNVADFYKFNDWLMKNNSEYRYGCDGPVSKNMYFVKYCYDKDDNPLWENEKNNLKEELKTIENEFLKKKKSTEDEIYKLSQEKEMFEKALKVIKNLKTF